MAFDITSAVPLSPVGSMQVIPTTAFDISTAKPISLPSSQPPSPISSFLRDIFRNSPLERIGSLQDNLDNKDNIPKPAKGENFNSYLKRWKEFEKPREEKIINEGVLRQVDAPMTLAVGAAGATAPVATAAMVGGFSIADHFFNARRWIEENAPTTPPVLKDVAEIADFIVKGAALGGGYLKVKEFTLDRMDKLNLPKAVVLPPEQVEAIKKSPIITEPLGITPEQASASVNGQTPIQVPIEKVLDLAQSKNWLKIQEKLGLAEVKPKNPIELPKFKNTEEAHAFGEANKDNSEIIKSLDKTYQDNLVKLQDIKAQSEEAVNKGNIDLSDQLDAQGLKLASENQFYREALQKTTSEKNPIESKLPEQKIQPLQTSGQETKSIPEYLSKSVPLNENIAQTSENANLIEEAKKYKTVEDFVNSKIKTSKRGNKYIDPSFYSNRTDFVREIERLNPIQMDNNWRTKAMAQIDDAFKIWGKKDPEKYTENIPTNKIDLVESPLGYEMTSYRKIERPIETVFDPETGRYRLVDGRHRLAQAKFNKDSSIIATVEGKSPKRQLEAIYKESHANKPPTNAPESNINTDSQGKERGFVKSVEESPMVGKETKSEMKKLPEEVRTYDVYSDKEAVAKAQERVAKDSEEALSYVLSTKELDKDVATTGIELMRKYRVEGKTDQEVNLAANLAERATKGGQFIQAFSILDKLSPEGILVFAQKEINKGITDVSKRKIIDPVFAEELKKQAHIAQETPYGYQKVVETNKLLGMIVEKRGKSKSDWINELSNLPRSLSASLGDFSFPGRQGIFLAPSFPKEWASSFGAQFGAFAKQENYNALMDSIMKHPDFKLAEQSGVSFTDIRTKLSKMEEKYLAANLAEKIPIIGRGVIATQRAYTAAANKFRIDVFSRIMKDYENLGIKPDKKLLEQTAEFVNSGTGRGSLGKFEQAATFLNGFFFSPRLMTSRLKLLNPKYYVDLEPPLRKQALKSLFTFIGTGATILTVAELMGADVGKDPRSSDFGKIKIGNTRIDIWGGFQQYVRMMAQQITGEYVSSTTGKKLTLGEGYKPLTRYEIFLRQIESKEAPVFSLITDILKQQNFKGEKINIPKETAQRFVPMVAQDMYDLYKEDPGLLPIGILSVFGEGVQTYAPKKSNKF